MCSMATTSIFFEMLAKQQKLRISVDAKTFGYFDFFDCFSLCIIFLVHVIVDSLSVVALCVKINVKDGFWMLGTFHT